MAEQLVEIQASYQTMLHTQAEVAETAHEKKITLLTHSVARQPARTRIQGNDGNSLGKSQAGRQATCPLGCVCSACVPVQILVMHPVFYQVSDDYRTRLLNTRF